MGPTRMLVNLFVQFGVHAKKTFLWNSQTNPLDVHANQMV